MIDIGIPQRSDRRGFLEALAVAGLAGSGSGSAWAQAPTPGKTIATMDALRRRIGGVVVARGDASWAQWCEAMVWQQRKPQRAPPLMVQAQGEADVIAAVQYAKEHGLKVGVRTGGHSMWSTFMRDEGVLIDLSQMTQFRYRAQDRTAVVQPALWGYHLIERLAPHGAAFPVAHCAQVGLGGFLIGGGLGLNHDAWGGMACFGIKAADVVTASGELVTVDAKQNSDLYWAVRGGGQGFPGIVTKLHLNLQERPKTVFKSMFVMPLGKAAEAAQWILDQMGTQAQPVERLMVLVRGDGSMPPVAVFMANAYVSSVSEAEPYLKPLSQGPLGQWAMFKQEMQESSLEKVLEDSVNPLTGFGFGSYAVDTVWTGDVAGGVDAAAQAVARAPVGSTHAVVAFKSSNRLPEASAMSVMDRVFIGLYPSWTDAGQNEQHLAWLRQSMPALYAVATGAYINEVDVERDPDRSKQCFTGDAWAQLQQVRKRWDPQQRFNGFLGLRG